VRQKGSVVQMGLTKSEISAVARQAKGLLNQVEFGKIRVY
jgi:hypothetical protein